MDAGRSFTWMLSQDGWVGKVLVGGLLFFVPIVGWILIAGYFLRTLRALAAGDEQLPAWDEWGDLFMKGLVVVAVGIIFGIPGAILQRIGLPFLSPLWSLLVQFVLPVALLHYLTSEENFGVFFDYQWMIDFIKANLNNCILAFLLVIVAELLAMLGLILLVVGVFFTLFWAGLVSSHLYGQVYRLNPATT